MPEPSEQDDASAVTALDRTWNDAYVRNDRSVLADVLADDFVATQWNGANVSKAQLIAAGAAAEVSFSEHALLLFGATAITRGRIRVERDGSVMEQRFVRTYAKRDGRWQAVAVQVFPIAPEPGASAEADRPAFDQLNVVVADMQAATDFYRRLGFEIRESGAAWEAHHRALPAADGFDFDLDSSAFARVWCRGWSEARRGAVIGFRVRTRDTVDRLYAELTSAGHRGLQPPYDAFWGARYAIVEDPDGNPVGLMSPSDAAHRSAPPDLSAIG